MKINVIYAPISNEYGSVFGTLRIEMNEPVEISVPELTERIRKFVGPSNLLEDAENGIFERFAFEEKIPEGWGLDCDVWSQERRARVGSINEALSMYLNA